MGKAENRFRVGLLITHMKEKFLLHLKLLLLILFTFNSLYVNAQTPPYYNIAVGTSTNAFPWSTTTGKGIQWIVNPGEFSLPSPAGAGNNITQIWFYAASAINATYTSFSVQLGQLSSNTDPSWTSATIYSGTMTTVINPSTRTITAGAGTWFSITLDVPFLYDPTQALVVYVSQCGFTGTSSSAASTFSSTGTRRKYLTPSSCVQAYAGQDALMSPVGITLAAAGPCTSPPTPGVATALPTTPCFGQNVSLNITGASTGSGQTYQWEDSSAATSNVWSPIAGATNAFSNVTPSGAGAHYYRCDVTCSGSTTYSTPVSVTVPTAFPGGTYTIDKSQPTGGTNFTSFTDAVNAISCGISGPIIFNVVAGATAYNEQITLPATIGSTATNTVTFNGNGDTLTNTIIAAGTNYATLNLDGADYVTFNNLVIQAMGTTYGFGIHLMNSADNNTFNNCVINASLSATATTSGCVSMSGSAIVYSTAGNNGSNNLFTGCSLTGGYFGFAFYGSAPAGNTNNSIINCNVREYYVYGSYNIQQGSASISNNIFERPTRAAVSTGYGVLLSTGCSNMLIEKNRVRKLWDAAPTSTGTTYSLYCSATSSLGNENKFYNNVVSDINFNGTVYGIYLTGATYVKAYHNTISLDQAAASGTTTTYGIYSSGTAGVDVKNNIVKIARGGTGTKYCLYYSGTGKTSNNNDLYINSAAGTNYIGYSSVGSPTTATTLAAWQAANTANAYDVASVSLVPIFNSPGTNDYTPGNSLLDNLGTPVGVLTDIIGNTRSTSTPDIGAYEFSVGACVGSPTAGTAISNITTSCPGGPVTLSLGGFTIGSGITIQWEYYDNILSSWMPISGANSSSYTVSPTVATDYRAEVTCANGGASDVSNTISISMNPFYLCYCSPLTGVTLHTTTANYITNVTIPTTTLNSSTTAVGGGGYTQLNPSIPSNTASLIQGQTYAVNATQSTTYGVELWIDWDQSGTFDAGEYYLLSSTSVATASISVPLTAVPGLTGMRLRSYVTTAFGASGACSNITTGRETEDYVITVVQAIQCTGTPSNAGTAAIDINSICNTGNVNLSLTNTPTELGITYQWQSSPAGQNNFTNISGATTLNYQVVGVNASTDFRASATCTNAGGGTAYSNIVSVTVNNPQLTSTTPGSRCGTGTVNLSAVAANSGVVNWYANASGGTPLAAGTNNFTTPVISTTTDFYAAASTGGITGSLGLPNRVGSTTNSGYTDIGLMFDAYSAFTINSVAVYPVATTPSGNVSVTIALKNSVGTILQTTTVSLATSVSPGIKTVVPLNFTVPAGTGYRLVLNGASGGGITGFIREVTSGFAYPYTYAGVASITSAYTSGASSTYYYYFYDWQISSGCEGTRIPVTASVTAPPAYTVSATPSSICSGSSSTLSVSSANAYTYTWTPGGAGNNISVTPTTTTKYYVNGVDANSCSIYDSVTVNVISIPSTVATVASPSVICVSGNVDLSLNPVPMTGVGIQWQKNTGSGFVDIPGANSATLNDAVTSNVSYQAKLSCNNNLVTTSTPVTVTYSNPSVVNTFPGSRCGAGPVTLLAVPSTGATIKWYDAATGGTSLGNGNAYTTPSIAATTTYYAAPVTGGGTNTTMPVPAQTTTNTGNVRGYYFTAPVNFTITGLKVGGSVTGNQSIAVVKFTGATPPPVFSLTTNAFTTLYMTQNNTATGIIPVNISVSAGDVIGILGQAGTVTPYGGPNAYSTTIDGQTTTLNRMGMQYPLTTTAPQDLWAEPTSTYIGLIEMSYSTGCEGTRVPVVATINGSPSGTGLSTGGTTVGAVQADGTTVDYVDACSDKVATVADAVGGNVLGTTSAIAITSSTVQNFSGLPYVPRVFDIAPSSSGAATVTLYVLQSEFNAYNSYVTSNSLSLPLLPTSPTDVVGMGNIVVTQYHGSASAGSAGPGGLYSNANVELIPNNAITKSSNGTYWTLTFPVSGFSGFYVHTGSSPLNVHLSTISAVNIGTRNRVDWTTATEMAGDYFEIERSIDGTNFSKLSTINAKGVASSYSYWDENPITGINYYRLKMLDAGGRSNYSKVVSAIVKGTGAFTVEAYPNPVSYKVSVKVYGSVGNNAEIIITDITGKLLKEINVNSTETVVDMNRFADGIYLLKYIDDNHHQTIKINKK